MKWIILETSVEPQMSTDKAAKSILSQALRGGSCCFSALISTGPTDFLGISKFLQQRG